MTHRKAAKRFGMRQSTISKKALKQHPNKPGRQQVFTDVEETTVVKFLYDVAKCGYPITMMDFKLIIKSMQGKNGRSEARFKNNMPCSDCVRSFMRRNNVSLRSATNIRIARASVTAKEIRTFFDNIKVPLEDVPATNVYNFDETNVTDDPGVNKVLVSRGTRRAERVCENSKTTFSIMFCGNAAGDLLPPTVVYKARNLYEN